MPKKISPEVKARALRMVQEHQQDYPSVTAACEAVGKQLGLGRETVRRWVVQADVDGGARPGATSAGRSLVVVEEPTAAAPVAGKDRGLRPPGVSRWVDQRGTISLAGFRYAVGATFAGEPVEVVVMNGLVEVLHAGVLVATHAQRLKADQADRAPRAQVQRRARDATTGLAVIRLADNSGVVSFAGATYGCGRAWARQSIDVTIVAGSVQLSQGGKVIRVHPIRHDRSRELGAFANPKGRPRRTAAS